MTNQQARRSENELQLQLVRFETPIEKASAAILLGAACEFSLSNTRQSRSALNGFADSSQGTTDSPARAGLAIKAGIRNEFSSQIIVRQHSPISRVRS